MTLSPVARLGDPSSHGGTIISASSDFRVDGIGVARTGDQHSCPIPGHGVTTLTGTAIMQNDGKHVVRVGDTAACGAAITAGSPKTSAG